MLKLTEPAVHNDHRNCNTDVIEKLRVLISMLVALTLEIFPLIHDSNVQIQSRYTIECGLPVDMTPNLWMKHTA